MTEAVAEAPETKEAPTTSSEKPAEERLWAGKYKTPEDMEAALFAQNKEVYKLIDEKKSLSAKFQEVGVVPETYTVPENLEYIKNDIGDFKKTAKQAGLSQSHFEKIIREMNSKKGLEYTKYEEKKQAIGSETLAVLNDYVKTNYPEPLHETIYSKLITDETARSKAMEDREKRLNSSIPAFAGATPGSPRPEAYDGEKAALQAGEEYRKNPTEKNKQKYIEICAEVSRARHGNK